MSYTAEEFATHYAEVTQSSRAHRYNHNTTDDRQTSMTEFWKDSFKSIDEMFPVLEGF